VQKIIPVKQAALVAFINALGYCGARMHVTVRAARRFPKLAIVEIRFDQKNTAHGRQNKMHSLINKMTGEIGTEH
jgi:hypothetical protein